MKTFEEAHPEQMEAVNNYLGGINGLNKYQHYEGSKVVEQWERNEKGELVDVTARIRAEQELEHAKKELAKLFGGT